MISIERKLLPLLLLCSTDGYAQRSSVVFDIDTYRPIKGVAVYLNPKGTVMTDVHGRFTLPPKCHSMTFSHVYYESRVMKAESMPDTVFLIPKTTHLDAVIVMGKAPKIGFDIKRGIQMGALTAPKSGISVDIMQMFRFRDNRHARNREKLKKILDKY